MLAVCYGRVEGSGMSGAGNECSQISSLLTGHGHRRHLIMFLRSWGMDIAVRLTEYMGARTLPTEASMNGVIFGSTGQLHQLRQF